MKEKCEFKEDMINEGNIVSEKDLIGDWQGGMQKCHQLKKLLIKPGEKL